MGRHLHDTFCPAQGEEIPHCELVFLCARRRFFFWEIVTAISLQADHPGSQEKVAAPSAPRNRKHCDFLLSAVFPRTFCPRSSTEKDHTNGYRAEEIKANAAGSALIHGPGMKPDDSDKKLWRFRVASPGKLAPYPLIITQKYRTS